MVLETRVLLYAELLLQVHRVLGHGVLGSQETTALQVVSLYQRHRLNVDSNPIAFLHVFHHSTMAFLTFIHFESEVSGVTNASIG